MMNLSLGDRIRELAHEAGLSIDALAKQSGVNRNNLYSRYLNEEARSKYQRPSELQSIAKQLDVSVERLLGIDMNEILIECDEFLQSEQDVISVQQRERVLELTHIYLDSARGLTV